MTAVRRRVLVWSIDLLVVAGLVGAAVTGAVVLSGGGLPAAAVAAPMTTTTTAPTITSVASVLALAAPVSAPPTTAPEPILRAPLTGAIVDDREAAELATRRSIAVKIDDAPAVHTHPGLDQADLVYEVLVEGGLTRYMAVFHSKVPDRVGPVRSVRTTDFGLVGNLGVPVLAFSGGNQRTVADALRQPVIAFPPDVADRGVYWRDGALDAPHNLFLSPAAVLARVLGTAAPGAPFSNPRVDATPAGGMPVAGVTLRFSNVTDSTFRWEDGSRTWIRYQRGSTQLDGSGRAVGVDNVIVLSTSYGVSPYDRNSPEAQTIGSGAGLVLSGGTSVAVTWTRPDASSPFTLLGTDGTPVPLVAGRSWVAVVPAAPDNARLLPR